MAGRRRRSEEFDEGDGDSKRHRSYSINDAVIDVDDDDDEEPNMGRDRRMMKMKQPELQIIPPAVASGHLAVRSVVEDKWSQLVEELLHQILKRLSPPDWHHFKSVCKSWRSVFIAHRVTPLLVRSPLLVRLHELSPYVPLKHVDATEMVGFHMRGGELKPLSMKLPPQPHNTYTIPSLFSCADGWLGANSRYLDDYLDTFTTIDLREPKSGAWISLPSMKGDVDMLVISSAPVSADCRVVAYGGFDVHGKRYEYLASCKVGDREWDYFGSCPCSQNMIFHNGKLYVYSKYNGLSLTRFYTFDPHAKMIGFVTMVGENPAVGANPLVRLVQAGDELLLVVRDDVPEKASKFRVFMLEDEHWIRVTGIGGRVLLLDDHTSVCLSVKQIAGSDFQANCIYAYFHAQIGNYFLVYSMDGESSQRLHVPYALHGSQGLGWWLYHKW